MFVEYDWTSCCYRFRFAQVFTCFRDVRSCETLAEVREVLAQAYCKLGRKTDSRTWAIELA